MVADIPAAADDAAAPVVDAAAARILNLLGRCVSCLSDTVLITEAEPLDRPGPRIIFVNEAFEKQTGYSPREVIGLTPRLLQGPKTDQAELRRMSLALRNWQAVRAELVNYKKDGTEFQVELDIVPIANDKGWYTHWVSIQRDVTARKMAEAQAALREAQRTESLGTLSIGIAHDFNNIIAAILGNVAIARQDVADGHDALDALEQINNAGVRGRSVVQQILAYGRRDPQAFRQQPLAPLVREAGDLLRATLPAGIALDVRIDDEPLDVMADGTQLNQVILNLGTNAWHAMGGRPGRIEIGLSAFQPPAGGIGGDDDAASAGAASIPAASHPAAPAARFARLRITDDGCGMDAATRARIFEPYYTTKPIGQGTGLGLSVVWGIVSAHGGTIGVESVAGRGTSFDIVLPLLEARPAPAPTSLDAPERANGNGERVMVVDDDEVVLLMLAGILKRAGFRVSPFGDPQQAIDAVRTRPQDFDVVVTDLNMPLLSGLQLSSEIGFIRRDLPVLIASGYVGKELADAARQAGAVGVVQKELAVDQLPKRLRDVLVAQRPALH